MPCEPLFGARGTNWFDLHHGFSGRLRHPGKHWVRYRFLERRSAHDGSKVGARPQTGAGTPVLATHRATCMRESTPSLLKMLARWLSTVRSEMNSWAAT